MNKKILMLSLLAKSILANEFDSLCGSSLRTDCLPPESDQVKYQDLVSIGSFEYEKPIQLINFN
jgi:hypothetical protein